MNKPSASHLETLVLFPSLMLGVVVFMVAPVWGAQRLVIVLRPHIGSWAYALSLFAYLGFWGLVIPGYRKLKAKYPRVIEGLK